MDIAQRQVQEIAGRPINLDSPPRLSIIYMRN